jgi:hypothetical protein
MKRSATTSTDLKLRIADMLAAAQPWSGGGQRSG